MDPDATVVGVALLLAGVIALYARVAEGGLGLLLVALGALVIGIEVGRRHMHPPGPPRPPTPEDGM